MDRAPVSGTGCVGSIPIGRTKSSIKISLSGDFLATVLIVEVFAFLAVFVVVIAIEFRDNLRIFYSARHNTSILSQIFPNVKYLCYN